MNKMIKRIAAGVGVVTLVGGLAACGPWSHRKDPEDMAQYVVEKATKLLTLADAQVVKLSALKDQGLKARTELHDAHGKTRTQALALLDQPSFDRAQALAMIASHTQLMNNTAQPVVNAFGDFYDSLTPQQQQTLRTELADRMEHHHGHGSWK